MHSLGTNDSRDCAMYIAYRHSSDAKTFTATYLKEQRANVIAKPFLGCTDATKLYDAQKLTQFFLLNLRLNS